MLQNKGGWIKMVKTIFLEHIRRYHKLYTIHQLTVHQVPSYTNKNVTTWRSLDNKFSGYRT